MASSSRDDEPVAPSGGWRSQADELRALYERSRLMSGQHSELRHDFTATIDELDEHVDRARAELLERAAESTEVEPAAHVALGLVARYYERIADHGVAFARDAAFVATGDRASL